MPVYVPNLVEGLGTVQVLFYNNMTSKWELITPTSVDVANKMIHVTIRTREHFRLSISADTQTVSAGPGCLRQSGPALVKVRFKGNGDKGMKSVSMKEAVFLLD